MGTYTQHNLPDKKILEEIAMGLKVLGKLFPFWENVIKKSLNDNEDFSQLGALLVRHVDTGALTLAT